MTKDESATQATSPPTTEQNLEVLHINLNEPLTDQLVNHPRFAPAESGRKEEARESSCGGAYDLQPAVRKEDSKWESKSYFSSEIMDLAVRRKNCSDGSQLNSENDKLLSYCRRTDTNASSSSSSSPSSSTLGVIQNIPMKPSSDLSNLYKTNGVQNKDDFTEPQKSDRVSKSCKNFFSESLSKGCPSEVVVDVQGEANWRELAPPPRKKNFHAVQPGTKGESAFLPIDSHPRDPTFNAVYKNHNYPYCILPFPHSNLPTTSGMFDYPPLSHPLFQSSPVGEHRPLTKAQSPSAASTGTALSPYVLYPDSLMTHQLEVLWQRKYPHHSVPPVWMLYQYMDELMRDVSRLPSERPAGKDLYNVSSISNSTPVIPSPVAATSMDKKKSRREFGDKDSIPSDRKKIEERYRGDGHAKHKNDCKDYKAWQTLEAEKQPSPNQSKNSGEWLKSSQKQRGGGCHPGGQSQQQQQQHQRRELLIDESASSAFDAVNQHFQESLLRLSSQKLAGSSSKGAAAIGWDVQQRSHFDDQMTEKHENDRGNGNFNGWKYKMDTNSKIGGPYEWASVYKASGSHGMSHYASKTEKAQPSQMSFDIYGYHPQHRPEYGAEKLGNVKRHNSFPSKPEFTGLKSWQFDRSVANFSKKKQEQEPSAFMGLSVADARRDIKDLSTKNSVNSFSKISEKSASCGVSAKLLKDVKFSAGNQSVASPTPGSVVKDSQVGPSCLIAGSPRPLPNIFYNPLDPVQPYHVSIESVERLSDGNAWTENLKDSYQSEFQIYPASLNSGLNGFTSDGIQRPNPPEAHSKIQREAILNPVSFPVVCEKSKSSNTVTNERLAQELNQSSQSFLKTSNLVSESLESRRTSIKRLARVDNDTEERAKKLRVNVNASQPISANAHTQNGRSPYQGVSIDSLKFFVDQAVFNAFLEDPKGEGKRQNISYPSDHFTKLECPDGVEAVEQRTDGSSESPLVKVCSVSVASAASIGAAPSHLTSVSNHDMIVTLSTSSYQNCCQPEPSCIDTLSGDHSGSSLSSLQTDRNANLSVTPVNSLHPSSPHSPPSPPRASSGGSLNLKKVWMLRYSDNNQKTLSDLSGSGFSYGEDNQSHCYERSSTGKPVPSVSESDPSDVSTVTKTQSLLISDDKANQPASALGASELNRDSHQTDSNCSSEASSDLNPKRNSRFKNSKRKASAQLPARSLQTKRCVSSPDSEKQKNVNSQKTCGKNSSRLSNMVELSKCNGLRTPHDLQKCQLDDKNKDENVAMDDNDSSAYSRCDTKSLRLRNKTRGCTAETFSAKDSGHLGGDSWRKQKENFLQDGSCAEVAPRLPKCRECKAQQLNKNNTQTTNICKFYVFRKLCYNSKGVVNVAGFLEPSDAVSEDFDLWMPSRYKHSFCSPAQAKYLLTHLKEFFFHFLEQETSLVSMKTAKNSDGVLWRRPIEGVQETCDVCDNIVFDIHWTCKKCGFVVCNDCHYGNSSMKDSEGQTTEENAWPSCTAKRQNHNPDDLIVTRIIPCDVLTVMKEKLCHVSDKDRSKDEPVPDEKFCGGGSEVASDGVLQMAVDDSSTEDEQTDTKRNDIVQHIVVNQSVVQQCEKERTHPSTADPNIPISNAAITDTKDNIKIENSPKIEKLTMDSKEVLQRDEAELDGSELLHENEVKVKCDLAMHANDDKAVPHFFDRQGVLHLTDDEDGINLFQKQWCQAMPAIITNCDRRFNSDIWKPEVFFKTFSHLKLELLSCLTGSIHRFQSIEKFWNGAKNSAVSNRTTGMLQFRDWPSLDDWAGSLSDHHSDLNCALPLHSYTLATGPFNLVSHLPEFFPHPDLTTRINIGYGNITQSHVTVARLQMNPVDVVNVVMYAQSTNNNGGDCESTATSVNQLLKDSSAGADVSLLAKNPEKVVAIWHIYRPQDSDRIQAFLEEIQAAAHASPKNSEMSRSSPSSGFGCYLDSDLQEKLLKDLGIQAIVVLQRFGDAVFIPALAFHQVKVIQDCISVSREFISPESIQSSLTEFLKPDRSQLKRAKGSRQDHFQMKNLVYHTVKDCVAVLSDEKL